MSKEKIILFITEGEKLDKKILKNIKSIFLPNKEVRIFPLCLNIYNLYKKINFYNEEIGMDSTDILPVIQEISKEQTNSTDQDFLSLKRNQVSEIYLFFDHDGHDTSIPEDEGKYNCINSMLDLFNNETDNGKLYINYPMIESYKHPILENIEIEKIYSDSHYKNRVSKICQNKHLHINRFSKDDWLKLLLPHLKSGYYLLNNKFLLPDEYRDFNNISQLNIHKKQYEKHINERQEIMVLSSFSFLLLEYFGEPIFLEWKNIEH